MASSGLSTLVHRRTASTAFTQLTNGTLQACKARDAQGNLSPSPVGHYITVRRYFSPLVKQPQRLSTVWIPISGVSANRNEDAHERLIRAGFLRQTHAGVFHLLPLGSRVQDKLEALLDHYMEQIGASRVSLSSVTSKELWQQSGRLTQLGSELFTFQDRRGGEYMLSPTHEEEITRLVAQSVKSYKELPLRLYQITRKYRDELRPRHGLLRTREFTMKDMYTFDATIESALETYAKIQDAYAAFFSALKLPFVRVQASCGDMGGNLSHEYHLSTPVGEDTIVTCDSCNHSANAEIAEVRPQSASADQVASDGTRAVCVWRGITQDRKTLVNVWCPQPPLDEGTIQDTREVNIHAVKAIVPGLETDVKDPLGSWRRALDQFKQSSDGKHALSVYNLVDGRLSNHLFRSSGDESSLWELPSGDSTDGVKEVRLSEDRNGKPLNLLSVQQGDGCPRCNDGTLRVEKALEVGHTFHLGTRYSVPLGASISMPANVDTPSPSTSTTTRMAPIQMGCHGIGVSRLVGAIAEHLSNPKGLRWPLAIAPYEAVIVFAPDFADQAVDLYSKITGCRSGGPVDVVLDDRSVSLPWKLKDADLVGYPIIIVLGKAFRERGLYEVQCHQLGVKDLVPVGSIEQQVVSLLQSL